LGDQLARNYVNSKEPNNCPPQQTSGSRIRRRIWLFLPATRRLEGVALGVRRRLHCTALHCTALHCTALHCPALHTALHTGLPDAALQEGWQVTAGRPMQPWREPTRSTGFQPVPSSHRHHDMSRVHGRLPRGILAAIGSRTGFEAIRKTVMPLIVCLYDLPCFKPCLCV
jgi:hypothetical protein